MPTQTTGVQAVPIRAGATHDRWPARDQGCHGRMSRDTPANCSSRSRHDDAELPLRGKRSNRVVHCPVERTLSPSAGPKRFSSRGVLLVAVKPEGLAACREHCMSKLKYIRSSAKRFRVKLWLARLGLESFSLGKKKNTSGYLTHQQTNRSRPSSS